MPKYADPSDEASAREEETIKAALANRVVYEGVSALLCEECGLEIHPERRKALPGIETCADCASMLERKGQR